MILTIQYLNHVFTDNDILDVWIKENGYGQMPQLERYASTGQSSTSVEYRGLGYYHPDADIAQLSLSYYSDNTSST